MFLLPPAFIVAGGWHLGGWEGALLLSSITVVGVFVAGVLGDARL